ncbi:KamA family radical SAM protein [Saccharicrinis fermentans]|uniref:L-lysine 2,3-aminomutase n=1 Tax=Saccharicrinis fermentans DSM 9555 = JCM 21142 TaxID=869213 RepID=W7Y9P2_9BACT|nr:4Fe-4S cluster-binding domain-containing protein [Saccharicrinis fermentans]GAF04213.1 L-lysine 2,3-aminomutase [Saccharicrinis fermentans DSM 9555 = JCM 21142]
MRYQTYALHNFKSIPQIERLSDDDLLNIEVVGNVLPFKTNNYVVNELIDWDNFRDDPMFILNFPQKGMLAPDDFNHMAALIRSGADKTVIRREANIIREKLNPHPAGQLEYNVPELNGEKLNGVQHKYRETMLFFPSQGQTCHAYCTFCFRWPQFTNMDGDLKFSMKEADSIVGYLKEHTEITDLLITGGDPMVMKAKAFDTYISKILEADIAHLKTIRIGSKSLSFWPYRFLTEPDADDLLAVFERITKAGKSISFMAHFNHPQELSTDAVKKAVRRIRNTGAVIRTQSPVLNHINASSSVWAEMWQKQVGLGMIPYYMFIARDTGAQDYFGIPVVKAWEIFQKAYTQVSGIARTVRGPSMSCTPGKIRVIGLAEIKGEKVLALEFIQGRNSDWAARPFFAKYDSKAMWIDDLKPAFGSENFFYEEELAEMLLK